MTNTLTTYSVRLHTDSSNIEQPNHRLSIIRWKISKERPKVPAARCVSVAKVDLQLPEILKKALQAAFEDLQDNLIRSLIETKLEKEPNVGLFTIDVSEVDEQRVADFAAETGSGTKLSTAMLASWFDKNLDTTLQVSIAKALGLQPENIEATDLAKVEAAMTQYRTFITSLAAPKSHMPENIAQATKKALDLVTIDNRDKIWESLDKKVAKFLTPAEITLAVNL